MTGPVNLGMGNVGGISTAVNISRTENGCLWVSLYYANGRWPTSSLFVAVANLMTARMACMFGFHLSSSEIAFPPRKKGRFPIFIQ